MHTKTMKNTAANFYLGLCVLAACVAVVILALDSVSYYEIKYGRDLVFTGVSKYLLAAACFSVAGGFALISKEKRRNKQLLEENQRHLILFSLAMVLGILAFVFEADILG